MSKVCKNCSWYIDFTGACTNGESEYRAEFVDADSGCEDWLGEEII